MTSIPSGRLNPSAQNGFSNAALYDKHRPSFPAHSVSVLLDGVRVKDSPQATVVDLAAGTGKFTELLAARDEGYKIIAIEPHADMRKVLEDKHLKGVSVQDGLSTDMKFLKDESVDAVIAAQVGHCSCPFRLISVFIQPCISSSGTRCQPPPSPSRRTLNGLGQ